MKKAIKLNKELSSDMRLDIYYINNHDHIEILKEDCDEGYSPFYGEQVMLIQDIDGEKYIFGASASSSWCGFKVDNNIDVENTDILALYKRLHECAFC